MRMETGIGEFGWMVMQVQGYGKEKFEIWWHQICVVARLAFDISVFLCFGGGRRGWGDRKVVDERGRR